MQLTNQVALFRTLRLLQCALLSLSARLRLHDGDPPRQVRSVRGDCCQHVLAACRIAVLPNRIANLLAKSAGELLDRELRINMPQVLDGLTDDYFIRGNSQPPVASITLPRSELSQAGQGEGQAFLVCQGKRRHPADRASH